MTIATTKQKDAPQVRMRPGPNLLAAVDAFRPTVGFADELWFSTDTQDVWKGTGSGWVRWSPVLAGITLATPLVVGSGGTGVATLASGAYLKGAGTSPLTVQVTPIPVADGGTGISSLTVNRVQFGNGASAFQSSANLTFDGTTLTRGNGIFGAASRVLPSTGTRLEDISASSGLEIGTLDGTPIVFYTLLTEKMRITAVGVVAVGTTIVTNASAGDLVLPHNAQLRFVNDAGNDTNNLGIRTFTGSNNLTFMLGTSGGTFGFRFAGVQRLELTEINSAIMLSFLHKVTADPAAPGSTSMLIFQKDNGVGKGQLAVRFATGAVQILATEP